MRPIMIIAPLAKVYSIAEQAVQDNEFRRSNLNSISIPRIYISSQILDYKQIRIS
jgi:hypothetical protein